MPRSLEGHVALVTGSTGEGMGRSTALTLAREGAVVVLNHGTNRTTGGANNRRLARAIQDLGARSIVVRANTAKGSEVRHMFARANAEQIAIRRSQLHVNEHQHAAAAAQRSRTSSVCSQAQRSQSAIFSAVVASSPGGNTFAVPDLAAA